MRHAKVRDGKSGRGNVSSHNGCLQRREGEGKRNEEHDYHERGGDIRGGDKEPDRTDEGNSPSSAVGGKEERRQLSYEL